MRATRATWQEMVPRDGCGTVQLRPMPFPGGVTWPSFLAGRSRALGSPLPFPEIFFLVPSIDGSRTAIAEDGGRSSCCIHGTHPPRSDPTWVSWTLHTIAWADEFSKIACVRQLLGRERRWDRDPKGTPRDADVHRRTSRPGFEEGHRAIASKALRPPVFARGTSIHDARDGGMRCTRPRGGDPGSGFSERDVRTARPASIPFAMMDDLRLRSIRGERRGVSVHDRTSVEGPTWDGSRTSRFRSDRCFFVAGTGSAPFPLRHAFGPSLFWATYGVSTSPLRPSGGPSFDPRSLEGDRWGTSTRKGRVRSGRRRGSAGRILGPPWGVQDRRSVGFLCGTPAPGGSVVDPGSGRNRSIPIGRGSTAWTSPGCLRPRIRSIDPFTSFRASLATCASWPSPTPSSVSSILPSPLVRFEPS